MSTTNYPSGSKLNPISEEIHQRDVAHHNWLGGWVGTSDNPTYYDRQNEERTCNGSHSAPYDADVYDELLDGEMWIGGWVLEEDEGGTPHELPTYITAESTTYPEEDEDGNVFGNEDYPIPIAVYEEMCELDIWTGGWVIYPNGLTEEFPENEGGASGSGSGSGSGCGCGCGNNDAGCGCGCGEDEGGSGCGSGDGYVAMGDLEIASIQEGNVVVRLHWNSGYKNAIPRAYFSIIIRCKGQFSLVGHNLVADWDENGNAAVTGMVVYKDMNNKYNLYIQSTYVIS